MTIAASPSGTTPAVVPPPDLDSRSASLPAPVARWLRHARPKLSVVPQTIYLEGAARFKRGRLPYLPLDIRIWTRLGFDRVSELEVRIAGLTLMRGLDAFVDGHGFTRVGSELSTGPSVDQGAFHVMFLETLLVPGAWPADIRWEPVDADSARVITPFVGGLEKARVTFDLRTGLPAAYSTDRYRTAGEGKLRWTATVADWHDFGTLFYPRLVEARWADQPQPWLTMRIERASIDFPMDEHLEQARRVLRERVEGSSPGVSRFS
jgi:hypothetical protein